MALRAAGLWGMCFALAGCQGSGLPDNIAVQQSRARLQAFNDCAGLERYVEDTAVQAMRVQLRSLNEPWRGGPPIEVGGVPTTAPQAEGAAAGPRDFTGTNNQVPGVDEGDIVKNDGTRILVLSGQSLFLSTSWPAASLAVRGRIEIEGWPAALFLDGDRAAVVSTLYSGGPAPMELDRPLAAEAAYWRVASTTKVTLLDVSNLASPVVLSETYLPGYYNTGRQIGASLRLVTSASFQWPEGVQLYPEGGYDVASSSFVNGIASIEAKNEEVIRKQSLDTWLPPATRRHPNGETETFAYDCTAFGRPEGPTFLGSLAVVTLPLHDDAAAPGISGVLSEVGVVYASAENLYVGTPHWWFWPEIGQESYTYLHRFDVRDASQAVYAGSGAVEGQILSSYSMDEHAGHLRVASTLNRRVPDAQVAWGRVDTTNRVSVLELGANGLSTVGLTPEIAPGESLFSARFIGDRGFLVTFRQVDPLFTLDLSDPTAPRVVGELKVPGFSTYLHPLDANHLIALGTYVPETGGTWEDRRLQLTLFDVTDFAHPVEKFTHVVGTFSGYSEAAYDPHAFNYFAARGLLAIPYVDWSYAWTGTGSAASFWSGFVSELRVFSVDAATGFTSRGALSMGDLYVQSGQEPSWSPVWVPAVRRSVMADDFVYAISDAGIRVARTDQLPASIATAPFVTP